MPDLVLHDRTAEQIDAFIERPSQALLLVGVEGVGKGSIAHIIASEVLKIAPHKLDAQVVMTILPEKNSISIDNIRAIHEFLRLKTIGKNSIRRAIIMEYADLMMHEAQNAFLKILEEPPADTLVILTANNQRRLLPTVLSRVQTVQIYPPSEDKLKSFFSDLHEPQTINQMYYLSGGMPGLMTALIEDNQDHELVKTVTDAKAILQKTQFERLSSDQFSDRIKAQGLTGALVKMAQAAINQSATQDDQTKLKQWYKVLKASQKANEALAQSANTKLVMADLFLTI